MSDPAPHRSRLARAARWLAPSAVAACAGAVLGGAWEAAGVGDLLGDVATVGFFGMLALPLLFALGAVARAVIAAWGPRELGERLTEDSGGMPVLAAWVITVIIASLVLAWMTFQGTWQLVALTSFKPLVVGFLQPMIACAAALLLVAASRPVARVLAHALRKLDRRRAARDKRSLFTPAKIFGTAGVLGVAILYGLWRIVIRRRIGPVDTSVLVAPIIAAAIALAVTLAWTALRPRLRTIGGGVIAGLALASVGIAVLTVFVRPALTLEIWGDRPLAGVAIERAFDLDTIRANISLAEFRPTDKPGSPHPDIVLITIDTVRADHTPPYGGSATMPVLLALGNRGAVFNWAFSPSNVTRRSIPSIVIGEAATRIKGRVVGWALRVDPRHVLLAERLAAAGYETAGFMCCHGFYAPEIHTGLQRGLEHLEIEANGRLLGIAARKWISEREKQPNRRPLFVWMHILEPHNWEQNVAPPRDDAERTHLYDHALTIADQIMGDAISAFSDRKPEDAPIVIVTADHGEALGEHGEPYHSTDVYNSQIHVPLVVAGPGIKPGHYLEKVSLTDLVPTIIELAGYQPPTGNVIDGRSLADLLTGKRLDNPEGGTAFAAMIKDRSNPGGQTAIVQGRWKLIDKDGNFELYDLHSDPGETTNLFSSRSEVATAMRKLLEQTLLRQKLSPFSAD